MFSYIEIRALGGAGSLPTGTFSDWYAIPRTRASYEGGRYVACSAVLRAHTHCNHLMDAFGIFIRAGGTHLLRFRPRQRVTNS